MLYNARISKLGQTVGTYHVYCPSLFGRYESPPIPLLGSGGMRLPKEGDDVKLMEDIQNNQLHIVGYSTEPGSQFATIYENKWANADGTSMTGGKMALIDGDGVITGYVRWDELKALLSSLFDLIIAHGHASLGAPPSNAADFTTLKGDVTANTPSTWQEDT